MTALTHLFVHVGDLARTRASYMVLLGLEPLMEGGGCLPVGGGRGFHIGIEERATDLVGAVEIEIVVRVADVDAAYERLREAGVAFDSPPADQEWGVRHAWLTDPDGYRASIGS